MGIFDRFFGRSGPKADPPAMSLADAERIVNAYAKATLEKRSYVADASALKHPKATVKEAILAVIAANPEAAVRERLKRLYVSLAQWQPGSRPGRRSVDRGPLGVGNPARAARPAAAVGPVTAEIPAGVAAEAKALIAELKARGF